MSEELKNCPFCGQQPKETKYREFGKNPREYFLYHCPNEECPSYFTKPGLMTAEDWDNRPIEDALNARIAELEGAIKTDDERLIRAGLTVGLYSGCDTAETMAEAILASRERIAELVSANMAMAAGTLRLQHRIADLETDKERAEQMVEKLIEAGKPVVYDYIQLYGWTTEKSELWESLVAEWYGARQ